MLKRIVIALALIIIFIPSLVKATPGVGVCTYTKYSELKKEASSVKISYDTYTRVLSEGEGLGFAEAKVKLYIENLTENIVLKVSTRSTAEQQNYTFHYIPGGFASADNLDVGISYTFTIETLPIGDCPYEILSTRNIKMPLHNEYYGTEVCKGIETFEYCKKNTSYLNTKTSEEFYEAIEAYRESLNNKPPIEEEPKIEEEEVSLLDFILENYQYLIAGTLFIFLVVLISKAVKQKKNKSVL